IRLGGSLVVRLQGSNALLLEAVSGDLILGANLRADGGAANLEDGGVSVLGGFSGVNSGELAGNGPGAPAYTASVGHGAAYGGHGSGESKNYGEASLASLLGGSAGGSSSTEGSGAGGGAIALKASSELIIEANVLVSANGGDGALSSAAGTGGALRLEATRIYNHGKLEARAGNGAKLSSVDQTRGSAGGRIAFLATGQVKVGAIDVSGEWLSNEGTVYVGGNYLDSALVAENAQVTFDTTTGHFSVEGGAHGVGIFNSMSYLDGMGQTWDYEICTFTFSEFSITGASSITLRGDKPLVIRTVAGGDVTIGADMILDGGDASTENGYGGRPVLNPWRGRSSERKNGFGPGGPPPAGNWGVGASYNYGDDQITQLLPGSSGSSGRYFQGSGAGGGALSIQSDGNLTITDGVVLSAKGGFGRINGNQWDHGGGGSGGAIRLIGKNVINRGLIQVDEGNRGAGGGRVVIASGGMIERGVVSVGSGTFKEIKPPVLQMPPSLFISYQLPVSLEVRKKVMTRPQNLRAYFPMDEGQGLSSREEIGGGNANLVGGTTWAQGKIGQAIRFNGTNGYLSTELFAEDMGIDGKRARTISFWCYVEGTVGNDPGFYGYGSFLSTDGANQYWAIRRINNQNYSRFQSEHWGYGPYANHGSDLQNQWVHLAHSYDGSNVIAYRDGSQVFSQARAEIGTGNQEPLQMGRWRNNNNAYFLGLLDDFRVYDDALTENEIQTIALGQDTSEETIRMQFSVLASENPTSFTISGLPAGLLLDEQKGEVYGLPQEVGVFDLNLTALNQAGETRGSLRLTVNKTPPTLTSSPPKNLSSTTAQFSGLLVSDGGEAADLKLYWGDNDGGANPTVDPGDSTLWDSLIDLNGTYPSGGFSLFMDNLEKNSTYYYRWLGGNSVTSSVWSEPTMDGLSQWWKFNENSGTSAQNEIERNQGTLVGMSDSDRIFGYEGKALRFEGDGGHVVIKGYKGILGALPRTSSMWVKTSDANGSLLSWGDGSAGGSWELCLENGFLKLDAGNASLVGSTLVNDGQWRLVTAVLPSGSSVLSDCVLFVDGSL
ncbi:MAG: LamG domain-containing protein, partial [Verrucomicrobiota bacterium]|nr:LamG domain-containing protein [Verrucomicrobiota bacterium]